MKFPQRVHCATFVHNKYMPALNMKIIALMFCLHIEGCLPVGRVIQKVGAPKASYCIFLKRARQIVEDVTWYPDFNEISLRLLSHWTAGDWKGAHLNYSRSPSGARIIHSMFRSGTASFPGYTLKTNILSPSEPERIFVLKEMIKIEFSFTGRGSKERGWRLLSCTQSCLIQEKRMGIFFPLSTLSDGLYSAT